MQSCSSITELIIISSSSGEEVDALMATLTVSSLPGSTILAPQLCLIFFGCESESYSAANAYLEMLKSRRAAANCALRSAALLLADGPDPESSTMSGLDTLRQEGLDLLVLGGDRASDEMIRWDYRSSWP
jgi:hypothetical protein